MKAKRKKRGLFVVFEGGEAVGKSTQIRLLAGKLTALGVENLVTRQPGGTAIGEKIRDLLLDPAWAPLNPHSELFLYLADRAQHVEQVINPALARGCAVICDRYGDSSTVYQGICRGLGKKRVENLNALATGNLVPDLAFVLTVSQTERQTRLTKRGGKLDRMELEKEAFHRKVSAGFLRLAKEAPRRVKLLNGALSPETLAQEIWAHIERKLG
jgi:dTMP kinase